MVLFFLEVRGRHAVLPRDAGRPRPALFVVVIFCFPVIVDKRLKVVYFDDMSSSFVALDEGCELLVGLPLVE